MCQFYTCSVGVVCIYLRPHLDTSFVALDYILATLVGGGLTLNVKRQQELLFARSSVPTPPRAPNCCLSRAVSCKLRPERRRQKEGKRKGKMEREREMQGKRNEVEYLCFNINKMLLLQHLHVNFLIPSQCFMINKNNKKTTILPNQQNKSLTFMILQKCVIIERLAVGRLVDLLTDVLFSLFTGCHRSELCQLSAVPLHKSGPSV